MVVGNEYVFPGFLRPVLTQHCFQRHRLLFLHAPAEVRGENTPERKRKKDRQAQEQKD